MPTQVETRRGGREPEVHTVQETVEDLTVAVNNALKLEEKFVELTGEDGKKFTVRAAEVRDIREA